MLVAYYLYEDVPLMVRTQTVIIWESNFPYMDVNLQIKSVENALNNRDAVFIVKESNYSVTGVVLVHYKPEDDVLKACQNVVDQELFTLFEDAAYITGFALRLAERGKKIGKSILRHAAKKIKSDYFGLCVEESNEKLINYYKTLGFQPCAKPQLGFYGYNGRYSLLSCLAMVAKTSDLKKLR